MLKNGINVTSGELAVLVDKINSELEYRVGTKLSELLTDEQLSEFEDILQKSAEEQLNSDFLETHVPDYRLTVEAEINRLKVEIADAKHKILYIMSLPHSELST